METEKKQSGNANRQKRRNRSKKQSKGKSFSKDKPRKVTQSNLLPDQTKKTFHSNLPQVPIKKVAEPKEVCVMCGKVIEGIASSLTHPEGGHCHFDCVLNKIAADEKVTESQKVSYIGRGTFAVVEQNEDGSFVFTKRIPWENAEAFDAMKKYVEGTKQ